MCILNVVTVSNITSDVSASNPFGCPVKSTLLNFEMIACEIRCLLTMPEFGAEKNVS